jgi:hypothetical protein
MPKTNNQNMREKWTFAGLSPERSARSATSAVLAPNMSVNKPRIFPSNSA